MLGGIYQKMAWMLRRYDACARARDTMRVLRLTVLAYSTGKLDASVVCFEQAVEAEKCRRGTHASAAVPAVGACSEHPFADGVAVTLGQYTDAFSCMLVR